MTNPNYSKYRLGLDLGTNSIGWAAISLDTNGNPCGVLDMGVRIFPYGRKLTDKTSKAVDRRLARGQRRRRDRYLKRRSELMDTLVEYGLMPPDKDERKALERLDPYTLRARALDEPLSPSELGRALFHLNQRRGFKSNRKAAADDENEAKKTRADISMLRQSIEESGARTLGEFLARRHEERETVRARPDMGLYPDRAMYEAEFDAIRESQESHHNLTSEQWERLRDITYFQRPLKPVEPGWCQFEFQSREKRASRALPVFQEFRMLQEVNNLRLWEGNGPDRPLDDDERSRVLKRLRSGLDLNLQKPPMRALRLPSGVTFNLSRGGRTKINGDQTTKRLKNRSLFGNRWLSLPLDQRNEIVKFLLETDDPEMVHQEAVQKWGLDAENAAAVANVSLVSGYGNLSEKAIRKLIPHMENRLGYSDAVVAAGYGHHSDFGSAEARERLPYYGEVLQRDVVGANPKKDPAEHGEVAHYGRIPNPTVHISLNQLCRVVNRLIEAYGKPEHIVVELARDLKMNRKQKQNYERQQGKGKQRNQRFKEMLESAKVSEVTPSLLYKLRLWEEQGPPQARVCPYTGAILSFEEVVSAKTEIDHILPFSKTWDDSPANKVVCIAEANRYKGDRSPYEAFGHSPAEYDYQEILDRAAELPGNKRWRFQPDAMQKFEDEDHFLDRQLNETRYLSRTARAYLAHLYDESAEGRQRVRVIPGRMTALLRCGWGLEGILRVTETGEIARKQRDDHRHHAIDAFVVANTTQGLLQRFAHASGSHHDPERKLTAIAGQVRPWEGFDRSQLQPFLDRMVVSYKPDHGTRGRAGSATTGQLHNETAYGLVKLAESGPSQVVVRKNLDDLKRSDLKPAQDSGPQKGVRDVALRAALLELWDEVGGKPAEFAQQAAAKGIMLNGRRQIVRRVRVLDRQTVIPIKDRYGKPYKGYKLDSNAFADVWRMPDGRWKIVAVPTFHANQGEKFYINRFRPHPAAKRLMRIYKDDMGVLDEGTNQRFVRVRKFGDGYVVLDDHNEADVDGRERRKEMKRNNGHSATRLRQQRFRKVSVDEIGRVRDPGPRT